MSRKAPINDGKFATINVVHSERCGKKGYRTRKLAATVAAASRKSTGEPIYAYHCDRGCACWHIGHETYAGHLKRLGVRPDAPQPPA